MPVQPHHQHRQVLFAAFALVALLIAPLTLVLNALAQVSTEVAPLAAVMTSPTSGQAITDGTISLKANVVGTTPNTIVTFLVSGPAGQRTITASGGTSGTVSTTAVTYEASMPVTPAENGAYEAKAFVSDPPTQRNVQTESVPFVVAFPQQTITQQAPLLVTMTAPSTVTGPFQMGAQTSVPVTELHFELQSGSTALSFPANASNGGTTWIAAVDQSHLPPNGTYEARAVSFSSGTRVESAVRSISVAATTASDNTGTTTDTSGSGTSNTGTTGTGTSAVTFAILRAVPESGQSFASGPIPLQVVTTAPASHVTARVSAASGTVANPDITAFTPSSDGTIWTAAWPILTASNGTYTVVFTAVKDGTSVTQASVFTLQRTTETIASPTLPAALSVVWSAPTATETVVVGTTNLVVQTAGEPDSAGFTIQGGPNAFEQFFNGSSSGSGVYAIQWDSKTIPNGRYVVKGSARKGTLTVLTSNERVLLVQNEATLATEPLPTIQPYVASFVTPASGATVSGTVTVAIKTTLASRGVQGYVSGASSTASPITARLSPTFDATKDQWIATWSAAGLNAGDYRISVVATSTEGRTSDAVIVVKVPAPTAPTETTPAETTQPTVSVKLLEPINVTVTGPVRLVAAAEGAPDSINFLIRSTAPGSTDITRKASLLSAGRWGATINEGSLTPGTYVMVAVASRNGATVRSAPAEFTIAVAVKTPVIQLPPEDERPLEMALVSPNGGTLRGVVKFAAKASVLAQSVRFAVVGSTGAPEPALFDAAYQQESGQWVAIWNSTSVADGTYRVFVIGSRGTERADSAPVTVEIRNAVDATKPPLQTEVPLEAVKQAVLEVPAGTVPLPTGQSPESPKPRAVDEAAKTIASECVQRGIPAEKCQTWLAGQAEAQECRAAGISTKEECLSWLKKQTGGELTECRGISDERCAEVEARKTAGLLSDVQLQKIDAAVTQHLNTVITLKNDTVTNRIEAASVNEPGKDIDREFTDVIPLRPTEQKALALRVHASPSYAQTSETESARRVPAVLLIDADEDGLPDDLEKRLGTDPLNADTDGDGFDDGTEIKNGFNPLGDGKIRPDAASFAPIDAAIVAGLPIEQPTEVGEVSEDIAIDSIASTDEEAGIRFEGTGVPGEVVSIFIYSYLPVVLTTTVGEDGTWSYDLDDALADGQHEAYVTVTDSTGKIEKKGNPLAFFVAEAKAATEEEYFGPDADLVAVAEAPVADLYRYYALGAIALVLVAGVLGALIFRRPKQDVIAE